MAETGKNVHPDPRRERLAEDFYLGSTIQELSCAYDIAERTVYAWLRSEACQRIIRDIRAAKVARVANAICDHIEPAAARLTKLVNSRNQAIALGAIRTTFDLTFDLTEREEVRTRLDRLEEKAGLREEEEAETC